MEFKAPRRNDIKHWQAIQMLHEGGVRYVRFGDDESRLPEGYQKGDWEQARLFHLLLFNGFDGYTPTNPVWKLPLFQWSRPRPKHPRDVPAYLDWWYDEIHQRIRMALDICDELGIPRPTIIEHEAMRGRLNLK
jgi:hypothetical protein